ncbi:hypothetical protein ACNKHO_27695 [Shigella flexneri]
MLGAIGHASRFTMMTASFNIESGHLSPAMLSGRRRHWMVALVSGASQNFHRGSGDPNVPGISAYTAMISGGMTAASVIPKS